MRKGTLMQKIGELVNEESMKISLKRNLNEINDDNAKKKVSPKAAYTEYLADKLVTIFDAPQSRQFFLKCAWRLPENTIWTAVEDSRKKCVKNPIGLFIFICNNALQEAPIKK